MLFLSISYASSKPTSKEDKKFSLSPLLNKGKRTFWKFTGCTEPRVCLSQRVALIECRYIKWADSELEVELPTY